MLRSVWSKRGLPGTIVRRITSNLLLCLPGVFGGLEPQAEVHQGSHESLRPLGNLAQWQLTEVTAQPLTLHGTWGQSQVRKTQ